MNNKFKIGDIVGYILGDKPKYKVMATKQQPYVRKEMHDVCVPEGFDYLIIKTPLEEGEFAGFVPVSEVHLELLSLN